MNRLSVILAITLTGLTSGCWFAAIPRFEVIERTLPSQEMVGEWGLSVESQKAMTIDGFIENKGARFFIVLRADGSCSYHTVQQRRYVEREGRWSLRYDSEDHYKHRLDFNFGGEVFASTSVALDSNGILLWEPWGDPDAGIDLVYRKKKTGEPDGTDNSVASPLHV